jgi:hypothetical protein
MPLLAQPVSSLDALQHAPTLNDAKQDYHDGNDQEDVDETSHRVRSDETQQPKDDQDNRNSL